MKVWIWSSCPVFLLPSTYDASGRAILSNIRTHNIVPKAFHIYIIHCVPYQFLILWPTKVNWGLEGYFGYTWKLQKLGLAFHFMPELLFNKNASNRSGSNAIFDLRSTHSEYIIAFLLNKSSTIKMDATQNFGVSMYIRSAF